MKLGVCPKCNSPYVMPKVPVAQQREHGVEELSVKLSDKPAMILFSGSHYESLKAWICCECGYTELYVDNPASLMKAYRRSHPPVG